MKKLLSLLILTSLLASSSVQAETKISTDNSISKSTLHVQGTAVLTVPADQVVLNVGALTENVDVKMAMQSNNEIMQKSIKAINDLGLKKGDYQTNAFSVSPKYSYDKFGVNKLEGYSVVNTIEIKTKNLALIGEIINTLTSNGINQINSISFGLENLRVHREKVIEQATINAKEDAKILATSSSLRTKKIISIEVDDAYGNTIHHTPRFEFTSASSKDSSTLPPIEAGDTTIRATVKITYEVEPEL